MITDKDTIEAMREETKEVVNNVTYQKKEKSDNKDELNTRKANQ